MERPREKMSLLQLITVPHLRRAITVSVVLHLTQQLGGINGVRENLVFVCDDHYQFTALALLFCAPQILYYSNDVFRAAGIPHPDVATVGTVGVVLSLITFVAVSSNNNKDL